MIKAGTAYFAKLDERAIIPKYQTELSAACDIHILDDISIELSEVVIARTGLICVPPQGYHWEVKLRSSSPIKYPGLALANGEGLIDSDYCGPEDELKLLLTNRYIESSYESPITIRTIRIPAGTRIAQMQLAHNIHPTEIQEISINELKHVSRGGFGSTND